MLFTHLLKEQPVKQQESRPEVPALSHTVQFYPLSIYIYPKRRASFSKRERYEMLSMAMES
jgi:hypothetical protein